MTAWHAAGGKQPMKIPVSAQVCIPKHFGKLGANYGINRCPEREVGQNRLNHHVFHPFTVQKTWETACFHCIVQTSQRKEKEKNQLKDQFKLVWEGKTNISLLTFHFYTGGFLVEYVPGFIERIDFSIIAFLGFIQFVS
jgi:hypothetical protein